MESGTNNIARLHLLLRQADPCLLGHVTGHRLRDPPDRQDQPGRAPRRAVAEARLRAAAHRPGHQHRRLPAHRARTAPDPPGAGNPAALQAPAAHHHQGLADPARPRPARRTGQPQPGQRGLQPDHPGRRAQAHHGTAHRSTSGAPEGHAHAARGGCAGQRALRTDDSHDQRHGTGSAAGGRPGCRCPLGRLCVAAPAAGNRRPVRGMAAGALSGARRPCDEPDPPEPGRQELRQPLRQPHAWRGAVRRPAGTALPPGAPQVRPGPPGQRGAGLHAVLPAGCAIESALTWQRAPIC